MSERGKFIVLYGANNLGKSTQMEMLQTALETRQIPIKRIKYPIYDLEPTGPRINAILRLGAPKPSEIEFQSLYTQNRQDHEPKLLSDLESGTWVITEDYIGTGKVWGMVRGVSLEDLEEMNQKLLNEDISLLLFGERFFSGKESTHINENDDELWKKANELHLFLAERYGWTQIYANQSPEKVHQDILNALIKKGVLGNKN